MTRPILVLGAGGQVGQALEHLPGLPIFPRFHRGFVFADHATCDITDPKAVSQMLHRIQPSAVINCAVSRNVDAEVVDEELNSVAALAMVAGEGGFPLVHLSTDYVFAGDKRKPYTPEDEIDPKSLWAVTKARGEENVRDACQSHIILRTSWLYGPHGRNFLKTMLAKAEAGESLRVVDDQVGAPTHTEDLAFAILTATERLIEDPSVSGTYHFAGSDPVSWRGFAQEIMDAAKMDVRVAPITTAESGAKAERPAYSALDSSKFEKTFDVAAEPRERRIPETLAALAG